MNNLIMPATLKDIAEKSGFSVTTVSRALTGYSDVSQKTRDHIEQIARALNYQPNHIARQLQGKRTQTLGLIMPERAHTHDDDFFSVLLKGITYEAARNGYDVLTSAAHPDTSELDAYRRIVRGKRVDGMIVARTHRSDPRIQFLKSSRIPFLVHGRLAPDENSDFNYIDVDSQAGIEMVTGHLLELGHQRMGLILPDPDLAFTPYRLKGFRNALDRYGVPFDESACVYGDLTYRSGAACARDLLNRHPDLTAIVAANDWMALGALATAREMNYPVGRGFAVTGYDDIPAASHSDPALTTVRQPIYTIGEQMTRQLISFIQDNPTESYQELIKPELVIRASSGGGP